MQWFLLVLPIQQLETPVLQKRWTDFNDAEAEHEKA